MKIGGIAILMAILSPSGETKNFSEAGLDFLSRNADRLIDKAMGDGDDR